jgi:hypothetical protein
MNEEDPKLITVPKKYSDTWIYHYWRPAIAWQYFAVCLFDFILFPILNAIYSTYTGSPWIPWDPLTLKESGFYHMAMGAIIGVAAWTKGQENVRRLMLDYDTQYEYVDNRRETTVTTQVPVEAPLMRRRRDRNDNGSQQQQW